MIDDDGETPGEAPFPRSYDSFKHMAGISLLSLGGVFAFAEGSLRFPPRQVMVILAFLTVALVVSILMAGNLAGLEVKPEPRDVVARRVKLASIVVGSALSGGLGGFTYNFIAALFK